MPTSPAPKKAKGRTLAEFLPLKPAEKKLLDAAKIGKFANIGGVRPKNITKYNLVRAEFLRFMILGGDKYAPVHERGVLLQGAYVKGNLDLFGAKIDNAIALYNCFCSIVNLQDSKTRSITFEGSRVNSIIADRINIDGSLFLRKMFLANRNVRLTGAVIGGDVDLSGGLFKGVFSKNCITCDGIEVKGDFAVRNGTVFEGGVSLSSGNLYKINDNIESWPDIININGLQYSGFYGLCEVNARERIKWLDKQKKEHLSTEFKPQPWEQLIKVLRQMGHYEDAKIVAIEKQKRLYQVGKIKGAHRFFHYWFGKLADYGYRPLKLVKWMAGVWLACGLIYYAAAIYGLFGPSNPLVFHDPRYAACRPSDAVSPMSGSGKGNWFTCKDSPGEYSAFSPFIYSLDVILPVVSLGQEKDWGPITPAASPKTGQYFPFDLVLDVVETISKPIWHERQKLDEKDKPDQYAFGGLLLRWLIWAETLFGWLATLLLAAVLSGAAKKDEG